jgi:NAD(P)-dependent dehydrogenase (short-subunit alcohol dehydrogenase family)
MAPNFIVGSKASDIYLVEGIKTEVVIGANRGIGKAFVETLIKRGEKKIYASMSDVAVFRKSSSECLDKYKGVLELVSLDITKPEQIISAVNQARNIDLFISNAGIANLSVLIAKNNIDFACQEIEVNYFGTLSMMRAFAPVLSENRGGTMVNVLSVVSLTNFPVLGSYSTLKAGLYSLTHKEGAQGQNWIHRGRMYWECIGVP